MWATNQTRGNPHRRDRHPLIFSRVDRISSSFSPLLFLSGDCVHSLALCSFLPPSSVLPLNTNEGPSSPRPLSIMANPIHRGRIIPIVMSRQNSPTSPPNEAQPAIPQKQPRQSPPAQSTSSRITRSRTAQTTCLELSSLNERGLYALPTEGDGMFMPLTFYHPCWRVQLRCYRRLLYRTCFLTIEP